MTNAVPYTYGGSDSVADFNADMDEQAAMLTASGYEAGRENPSLAPSLPPQANDNFWLNYENVSYMPNYSYIRWKDGNIDWINSSYSAGVDCAGYVARCASYAGTNYLIGTMSENARETIELAENADLSNSERYPLRSKYPAIFLANGVGEQNMRNLSWEIADIGLLVPRDIVYENGHIAIVNWINYTSNTKRLTSEGNIHLIDATTYNYLLKVQNTQTLAEHIASPGVIFKCRLKTR